VTNLGGPPWVTQTYETIKHVREQSKTAGRNKFRVEHKSLIELEFQRILGVTRRMMAGWVDRGRACLLEG